MDKSYVISVSLKTGCYRHIRIDAEETLEGLHAAILDAFAFQDGHAHGFFMTNRLWDDTGAYLMDGVDGEHRTTGDHTLEEAGLEKEKKFKYVFDFVAEWVFQCRVLRELPEKTPEAEVIRRVGENPEQYPEGEGPAESCGEEASLWPKVYDERKLAAMRRVLPVDPAAVDTILDYFTAAANLYGIIPVWKLMEIYNSQNPPVPESDFLAVTEMIRHQKVHFAIVGQEALQEGAPVSEPRDRELIVEHLYVCDLANYKDACRKQQGKAYAVLPKAEFLRYRDEWYCPEIPEAEVMCRFLMERKKLSREKAWNITAEIRMQCSMDLPVGTMLAWLQERGMVFADLEEVNAFLQRLQMLNNRTRKLCNRGYTPEELFSQRPVGRPGAPVISGKPSRNGPCPCGSGRKYKNCCGAAKARG